MTKNPIFRKSLLRDYAWAKRTCTCTPCFPITVLWFQPILIQKTLNRSIVWLSEGSRAWRQRTFVSLDLHPHVVCSGLGFKSTRSGLGRIMMCMLCKCKKVHVTFGLLGESRVFVWWYRLDTGNYSFNCLLVFGTNPKKDQLETFLHPVWINQF